MAGAATRNGLGTPVPADVCFNGIGYEDVTTGAAVTIRDGAGSIVATTTLGGFVLVDTRPDTMQDMSGWDSKADPLRSDFPLVDVILGHCQFSFAADVPDAAFYSVEVAHRGAVNFSTDDLSRASWTVALTVG
jgi:hypothetical protein